MTYRELLYEGKAKIVYATDDDNLVIVHYKDDTTAFNGEKKETIADKGIVNNKIAAHLFSLLEKEGVPTHFVSRLNERAMLCKKLGIIPLEVIVRNTVAGSMAKRLGLTEGAVLNTPVFELSYKNDTLGDPLINDYHAVALGAARWTDLEYIKLLAFTVNNLLCAFFSRRGIRLIDFKLEFGKTKEGTLVLADEISPDTCRFWDASTGTKLDKDRFRRNLGNVKESYLEILHRIESS
ncbi:MAG: phosphoribosylaminoimidazolesuccinocarboxamide synthase [Spirochaetaceae bacterium]|jgi:phosphoribosylaminoimidazole-succinocarboxamide synthase|nr:phosphoribosylaminoimidazolesuccinocarboxamide synthase [Spirochaetaceae bacterium]